jgi:hypothetical protein
MLFGWWFYEWKMKESSGGGCHKPGVDVTFQLGVSPQIRYLVHLMRRVAMETSLDPKYKRPGQRVIVYPKFLDKLGSVLASGNIGLDTAGNRHLAYEKIMYTQSCCQNI